MVTKLKATAAVQTQGRLLVIHDCKSAGESKTHPRFRLPPMKAHALHQRIRAVLKARMRPQPGDAEAEAVKLEIGEKDDYVFFDGRVHNHEKNFKDAFEDDGGALTRVITKIYVMYDEDSIANIMAQVRTSDTTKELTEYMLVCTKATRKFPDKKRKNYSGSCRTNFIGPVAVADHSTTWSVTFKTKKAWPILCVYNCI